MITILCLGHRNQSTPSNQATPNNLAPSTTKQATFGNHALLTSCNQETPINEPTTSCQTSLIDMDSFLSEDIFADGKSLMFDW